MWHAVIWVKNVSRQFLFPRHHSMGQNGLLVALLAGIFLVPVIVLAILYRDG